MPKETLIAALKRQGNDVVNHLEDKNYEAKILSELDNTTDFNAKEDDVTALMIACEHHNYLAVEWLFSKRSFLNKVHLHAYIVKQYVRILALSYAVQFQDFNENTIDYILKRKRSIVDTLVIKLNNNRYHLERAIHQALRYGNLYFVCKYSSFLDWYDISSTELLNEAIEGGLETVKSIAEFFQFKTTIDLKKIICKAHAKDVAILDFLIQQSSFITILTYAIKRCADLNSTLITMLGNKPYFTDLLSKLGSGNLLSLLNEAFNFNNVFVNIVAELKTRQFSVNDLGKIFIKACYANDVEKIKLLLPFNLHYQFDTNTGYPKSDQPLPITTNPRVMNLLTAVHYLTMTDETKAKEAFKLLDDADHDFIIKHFNNSPALTKNFVSKVYGEVLNPERQKEGVDNINYVPPPAYGAPPATILISNNHSDEIPEIKVNSPSSSKGLDQDLSIVKFRFFPSPKASDPKKLFMHYQTILNSAQQNFITAQSNLEMAQNNLQEFIKQYPEFDDKDSNNENSLTL